MNPAPPVTSTRIVRSVRRRGVGRVARATVVPSRARRQRRRRRSRGRARCVRPERRSRPDDGVDRLGPSPIVAPVEHHRAQQTCARRRRVTRRRGPRPRPVRAGLDCAPSPMQDRRLEPRVGVRSRLALHPDARRALARARRRRTRRAAGEHVGVGLQVLLRASRCRASRRRSRIAYSRPGSSSIRGNVSRSIDTVEPRRDASQHRRLEHVGAGVDPVGRRLALRRLLDERHHLAVVAGGHDAERRRVRRPG